MAVVIMISLNRFLAPVDDTVTAQLKTQVTSHKFGTRMQMRFQRTFAYVPWNFGKETLIAKNVPKMFQDSRCLTETPRFLDEIPRFPIDRNSKISEIPKPKVDSESSIFPLLICRRFTNKNHLSYLAMASDVMSPHTLTF